MKKWWHRLSDIVLTTQPLFAVPIFLSVLFAMPPLWLSWIIALIPWGLRFWRTGRFTRRTPFDIPILIFVLGLLVGVLVSPNKAVSLEGLHTFLGCILIYYGIVNNTEAKSRYWMSIGAALCLIFLGIAIYTFSQGIGRHVFFNEWAWMLAKPLPKINTPGFNLNAVGAALAVALPLLLAITIFGKSGRLRLIGGMSFLGFSAVLILSASGGGWISVIFGLVFVVICWRFRTIVAVLPALGFAGCAAAYLWYKTSWFANIFPVSSITGRVDYWRNTLDLLKDHPFSGCGLGAWADLYRPYASSIEVSPHNTYLQLYADTGIAGGIAIVAAAVIFVWLCWRILSSAKASRWYPVAIGVIGGTIAGAVNALIEVNTSTPIIENGTVCHYVAIPYLWVWAALLVVAYNRLVPSINYGHVEKQC